MTAKKQIKARDYLKVIEWSEEDGCYIGSAPPLIGRCCHGATESKVIRELSRVVAEWMAIYGTDKRPAPAPIKGREYSGKFIVRLPPPVHQALALRALAAGQSLNSFCAERLTSAM